MRVSIVGARILVICDSVQKSIEGKDFQIWASLRISRALCESEAL